MCIINQWLTQYLVAIATRIQNSRCFLMWSIKVLKSKTCHCYQFQITHNCILAMLNTKVESLKQMHQMCSVLALAANTHIAESALLSYI